MNPWVPHLIASCLLFAGARMVSTPAERTLTELGRPLAGPLVLPFLWKSLADSYDRSPEEAVARGRILLELLPSWVDGHIYLAQSLAFAGDGEPGRDLDRILAALALLDEARQRWPAGALDFLLTEAFVAEFRVAASAELAAEFRTHTGRDALDTARGYLELAEQLSPAPSIRLRQAFLTEKMAGLALRRGDLVRARAATEAALQQFDRVIAALHRRGNAPSADNAEAHRRALARLGDYLQGDASISVDTLLADPYLEGIADGLSRR